MSWQESLGKNLIKNVEVKIGDNKTIGVDTINTERDYERNDIIEKPVHIGVDIITSPNRDLRTPIIMPENEKKFHCVMCNFVCSNKYTYMQHIIYKRHNTPLKPLQK